LRPFTRTSFHHQPEAQHQKSSAIHKLPADYPIFALVSDRMADIENGREAPILLQKSFAFSVNRDSVALMRFRYGGGR
jgi:hypothetical protein